MHASTLQEAVRNAGLVLGIAPHDPNPTAARLPLATPVKLRDGVLGVVVAQSSCTVKRVEVAWFDRHYWIVRRRWFDVAQLEVLPAQTQTAVAA